MQKVEPEEIVKYILDHPSVFMWYRWYLRQKYHLPYFTMSYSHDLRQKGVPVDFSTRDGVVIVLVPIYAPYGVGGGDILTATPESIVWTDGDIAYFGNWKFYGKFAWMVALNRKHPLRRYALTEMEKEARIRAGKA